jgi:tRNA(Ile)-lysidine synthase TilS/MesJ
MKTYVSFSGGADSTALAIYLKDQGHEIELVMADTGAELPETLFHVPQVAKALGCELTVLSHGTFFAQLVNWGFHLPSMHRRWCTRVLKMNPLNQYAEGKELAVGICADEDHRVPDANRPLVDAGITSAEAKLMCEKHGLLNPCYKWRSSCSCFCCPFQRKWDWRRLATEHPTLFALADEWEQMSIATTKSKFGWNQGWTLNDMRMASEDQMELFEEPRETACAICRW